VPSPDLVKHLRRLIVSIEKGLIWDDIQVCSERIPRYSSSALVGSVGAMLFACSRSADVFDIGSVDIVGIRGGWRVFKVDSNTDAHQDTQVRSIT
jgi:hypothetical protein